MEGLAFTISLNDLLTAPARNVSKALMATSGNAGLLRKNVESLERAMVKSQAIGDVRAVNRQRSQLAMLNSELEQTPQGLSAIAGPAGFVAEALAGATVAAAGLVVAGASLAIEQSELKAKLISTFDALGKGPNAGKKTLAMLDDLSNTLPQTREQLAGWSKDLMAMGMTDLGQLQQQLKATASAQALMGDEGADAMTNLTRKIQEAAIAGGKLKLADKALANLAKTGVNVADVAAKMGMKVEDLRAGLSKGTINASKFGDAMRSALIDKGAGPLARMGGSLTVLGAKFKENIGKLFEDVDPGPFLDSLKDIVGVFSQGTASGRAMKTVIGGFFTGLFGVLGKIIPVAKTLFLGMIIMALKSFITIKPFIPMLKMVGVTLAIAGAMALATFVPAMVASAAATAAMAASAIAAAAIAAAPFLALAAVVVGLYEAFTHLPKILDVIKTAFKGAVDIGGMLIHGLVDGISNGAGLVIQAVKGLGSSAMGALKGILGIHSPSKEFAKLGAHTGAGFAQGLEGAGGVVHGAAAGMASAAGTGAATASGGGGGGSKSGGAPIVVNATFEFNGAPGAALELTAQAVSLVFERIALAQGL